MDYGSGVRGTHLGGIQPHSGSFQFSHIYSPELQRELLQTLLKYPILTRSLNYLSVDGKVTQLALDKCIVALKVDVDVCYHYTPQWKLDWYN